jgi:sensor histidine kinase regulating citrate/malate metabolism
MKEQIEELELELADVKQERDDLKSLVHEAMYYLKQI